jgi:Trypsin-like peptidase domain
MTEWIPAVARLRNQLSAVGGGALIPGGKVLTCAHVVNAAVGRKRDAPEWPSGSLSVDFPLQGVNDVAAKVIAWSPLTALGHGDIALLELADDRVTELEPLMLAERVVTADEELATFGFPRNCADGVHKRHLAHAGTLVGGWGQLVDRAQNEHKLQPGFSGCPVLDAAGYVIGVFTQAELAPDVNVGAYIPTARAVAAVQAGAGIALPSLVPGPIDDPGKEIALDTEYYVAKLGSWPAGAVDGADVVPALRTILQKVETSPGYRQRNVPVWATLYRMIGGAYLLHSKLDMGEKVRAALPYLRQSHALWPEQAALAENIGRLESMLRDSSGDVREFLTTVLQILRGPGDPDIPSLVGRMAEPLTGPQMQAQSWLLHQATPNPIWNFLQAVQVMLKKERNIDAEIDVGSELLADGDVDVRVTIGPNVFLWKVDPGRKTFEAGNDLTAGFMRLIT